MWLVLKVNRWKSQRWSMLSSEKLVLSPDCGDDAHRTCTIIAAIPKSFPYCDEVKNWLDFSHPVAVLHSSLQGYQGFRAVRKDMYSLEIHVIWTLVTSLSSLTSSFLVACVCIWMPWKGDPLFLRPLAVLWWAAETQTLTSQTWFLTRFWGEGSRATKGTTTGLRTQYFNLSNLS